MQTSVYHAVSSQTDGTPLITACGQKISLRKLRAGRIRWLGISRDLMTTYPCGALIFVFSSDKGLTGWWRVYDKMGQYKGRRKLRVTNHLDFLVPKRKRYTQMFAAIYIHQPFNYKSFTEKWQQKQSQEILPWSIIQNPGFTLLP